MHLSSAQGRVALLAAAAALVVPLFSTSAAFAQEDTANVGVARISLISGSVAVQRGDATNPSSAVINAPVLAGDYLTTGDDSRAEVEINGGTVVRLGDNVQMRFTHLENDTRAIQLAEGTIELRLLRGTDGTSNIDTPSISVRPRSSGSYRVSVTSEGQTLVTVRSGDAEIIGPQGAQPLSPGTTIVAQGASSDPSIVSQAAIGRDGFDQFNAERDARYEHALADNRYVDANVTGVQDLDAYGHWVSDPSYGQVWAPTHVASDWAPYRDGRWVWEDGFGWTWVGAEPWGWAPYHYGSWYRSPSYGWCWYPPRPAVIVPVWRPALVAFFSFGGGGGGLSVGFGGGNIGWVPLAPYEAYHPWWGNRWGGGGNNITNVTINNTYINNGTIVHNYRNAQYGVTSVPGQRFTEGDFRHPLVVAPGQLRNVQAVRGALPIVPTAANLRYSEAHVAPQLAVRPSFTQHTFAGAPAPERRVTFEQQRSAISTAAHVPLTPMNGALHSGSAPAVGAFHGESAPNAAHAVTGALPAANASTVGAYHGEGSPNGAHPVNGAIRGGTPAGADYHPAAAPGAAHPANDAWTRFGQTRGVSTPTAHVNAVPPAVDGIIRGTGNFPATSAAGSAVTPHAGNAAWGRFNDNGAARTTTIRPPRTTDVTPRAATGGYQSTGSAPATVRTAPDRAYNPPAHTYNAPVRTQNAAAPAYNAPVHPYNAPAHTYNAPARTYNASADAAARNARTAAARPPHATPHQDQTDHHHGP